MIKCLLIGSFTLLTTIITGQDLSTKEKYLAAQKVNSNSFSSYFYPNYSDRYSLSEKEFVVMVDSVRAVFEKVLENYASALDPTFVLAQRMEIKYFFDRLLLDYPNNHDTYVQSSKRTTPSKHCLKGSIRI